MPDSIKVPIALVRAAALFRNAAKEEGGSTNEACRNLMVMNDGWARFVMGANPYAAAIVTNVQRMRPGDIIKTAQECCDADEFWFIEGEILDILSKLKDEESVLAHEDEDGAYGAFPNPDMLFPRDTPEPSVFGFGANIMTVLDKAARCFKQKSYRLGKTHTYDDTWVSYGAEPKGTCQRSLWGWHGNDAAMVVVTPGRIRDLSFD